MTQISILSGITADAGADIRTSFPVNMIPVPTENGVSAGYLRTAEGIVRFDTANIPLVGRGRGGIFWQGVVYWAIGTSLVSIAETGAITLIGSIGDDGRDASFAYSFDRLAVTSAGNLFYVISGVLSQVTDPDLGIALDVEWMDGYFITTDGTSIVVTELNDPYSVDPLKYGSSEADPDPILALIEFREELYAFNRYTTEVFDNVGGTGFPFSRNTSAMINKGTVGTYTCCIFDQALAFMGGGFNEPVSVYLGAAGSATKIATREVEDVIAQYSESELASSVVNFRANRRHQNLCVHLPRHTLIYDAAATLVLSQPIWYILSSSTDLLAPLQGRHWVLAYGKWLIDDRVQPRIGSMNDDIFTQYGEEVGWRFDTVLIYNESLGGILKEVELVGTPGRAALNTDPCTFLSWTQDGLTWGDERLINLGKQGERNKRIAFRPKVRFKNFMGLRYRGANASIISFMRLEAKLEPLNA